MITGIHHVALLVSSEEALDFYKKLGFTEVFRKTRANDTVALLDGYEMQLEVFVDGKHPKRPLGSEEPLGTRHFALKVDNLRKCLMDLGFVQPDIGTDWQGIRYCFITDPDGGQVELHE